MKRFLCFLLIVMASVPAVHAQNKVYCEIIEEIVSQKKTRIYLDYGQERRKKKDIRLKNEEGMVEIFSSRVEALNIMSALGWNFEQVYVDVNGASANGTGFTISSTHYLLSKEMQSLDELNELAEKIKAKKEELDL